MLLLLWCRLHAGLALLILLLLMLLQHLTWLRLLLWSALALLLLHYRLSRLLLLSSAWPWRYYERRFSPGIYPGKQSLELLV